MTTVDPSRAAMDTMSTNTNPTMFTGEGVAPIIKQEPLVDYDGNKLPLTERQHDDGDDDDEEEEPPADSNQRNKRKGSMSTTTTTTKSSNKLKRKK